MWNLPRRCMSPRGAGELFIPEPPGKPLFLRSFCKSLCLSPTCCQLILLWYPQGLGSTGVLKSSTNNCLCGIAVLICKMGLDHMISQVLSNSVTIPGLWPDSLSNRLNIMLMTLGCSIHLISPFLTLDTILWEVSSLLPNHLLTCCMGIWANFFKDENYHGCIQKCGE